MKYLLILAFAATIPIANWMIGNIGTVCYPDGPCVLPVWPSVYAPSGVLMIGVALVLRDLVQRVAGPVYALAAVAAGTVLSFVVAHPAIAAASAIAFLFSELVDFAVYTPLARRRLVWAIVLSGLAGAVVDSALFLWLAFNDLSLMPGQVIGKIYASLLFGVWASQRPALR